MSEQIEIDRDDATLVSIASEAFPIQCLACRSEHRIDALTNDLDPDLRALERVACPSCGVVGLWPPNRPVQELQWANPELWDTYGGDLPLPEGQVVLVPGLCGHEVSQRTDIGAQPTYCEQTPEGAQQAHTSRKAGDRRKALVRKATNAARRSPAPVQELVSPPESADAVAEEAPGNAAESVVEPSVVEMTEVEALEAVRADLAAARRLADDSAARVTRAAEGFAALEAVMTRERADLERRCADAEEQVAAARRELEVVTEQAATRVAAAEQAALRAEGRAEELAGQLTAARRGELQEVVESALDRLGSRRGAAAGVRISKQQREMVLRIGAGRTRVVRDVAGERWFVDGQEAVRGAIMTLDSLLRRKWINWSDEDGTDAEYAAVRLIGGGTDYFSARTGAEPSVVAGVGEDPAAEDGLDPDVAPDHDAAVAEGWAPPSGAVDSLLRRVDVGGVTRRADRSWQFEGGVTPPKPAIQTLNWMLANDLIYIGDGDPAAVHVTGGVEGA